jgi:DNA invertase Pin-like site-specific DNA recombinase
MTTTEHTTKVIGYARVSTTEQHDAGAGLPAQVARLTAEATGRGWDFELVTEEDGRSAGTLAKRDALGAALARLDRGDAHVLVVTKLDRLTRSVADFAALLDRAKRRGWQLIVLDLGVDTTTPAGEMVANVIAAAAQYERRMIAQRTREAMAQRRAEGVHLGRRSTLPQAVRDRIVTERNAGRTLQAICDGLNDEGIATGQGGAKWYPTTVSKVCKAAQVATMAG